MNLEEFLNNFKGIIPYNFKVKIGGARSNSIICNKDLISESNRKGRIYPFYKKILFDTKTDYIPLDEMNVPIELIVECQHPHILKWEEKPESTKKERFQFQVRILDEDTNRQLGYISLNLTPAGDIVDKFCSFYSEDGTHEIMQSINYKYDSKTKKVTPTENLSFIFYNLDSTLEEKVSFYKENSIVKGLTINKQALKNHAFDSIVWSSAKVEEKCEFYSRYRNNEKVEHLNCLASDMTNYLINKDFTSKLERLEDLQRTLSYEGDPLFNFYNYDKIREEIEFLKDPKNDIFSSFYGDYIGNTIIKIDSKMILFIETLKDDYHYFTSVDITDTDAFDVDFYHDRKDGTSYYQAIESSDKRPKFRLKIENGSEVLIPLGENISDEERKNFELLNSYCDENIESIEAKKLATFSINKYSSTKKGHELVKKGKNI